MTKLKNSVRLMIGGFVGMLAVCILVVSAFAIIMKDGSEKAVNRMGSIYMENINKDISLHFQTVIEMHMNRIETLIAQNPPQSDIDAEETAKRLPAKSTFGYLALMSRNGDIQVLKGEDMTITDKDNFLLHLNNRDEDMNRVVIAESESGVSYILFGVSTVYPMLSGEECTALIAGVPVTYFNDLLSLGRNESSLTFSNVIDTDGDYVIKNYDDDYTSYFERVLDLYGGLDGKNAEEYISEIKDAINTGEDYTTVFLLGEERRHLYCTPLPNSDWYLLTIMPFGEIENIMGELENQRSLLLVISIIIIIAAVGIIFLNYYKMTQMQIKALEAARREAEEASKAKSEFLSNMSHDIRTPMNAIVGMTAIAAANIDNKEKLKNTLQKISRSNKQLLGLINDILDMSKIESGKMTLSDENVSLREVLDDTVNIIQSTIKAKNQEFDVFVKDIISENVITDSVRLSQVIMNLVSNAMKFTPEGGRIEISVYQESSDKGDEYVKLHLEIKDNGIGMSEEFREKVFESFSREDTKRVRKTQGTGLGMAITKYIIDAMQGNIEVESEQGKGTKFSITVDMKKADESETAMNLPDWNILVVDDDLMLCESAVTMLRSLGAKAEYAMSGEGAVKKIRESQEAKNPYKVILIDWCMPVMDGVETARVIKKEFGDGLPLLLISAYDWLDIQDDAVNAGVSGFISKPLFKSTLFHALRRFDSSYDESEENAQVSIKDYSNIRILVAEDNDLNWEIADELFSQEGFKMERAENGQRCLEMFSKSPLNYYSVILMDLRMPVMTGTEATKAIRKLDRPDADVPIIAMTADAFAEDIRLCLDSGMNAHVAKPIQPQEVIRSIERVLNK